MSTKWQRLIKHSHTSRGKISFCLGVFCLFDEAFFKSSLESDAQIDSPSPQPSLEATAGTAEATDGHGADMPSKDGTQIYANILEL